MSIEAELINIYLQIASELKAIHEKHIIHRDLKSANIFIIKKNVLILKIGDFNVSKKLDYTKSKLFYLYKSFIKFLIRKIKFFLLNY